MKIFVDENIPLGQEAFQDHGEVVRFAGRGLKRTDLTGADALIVRSITKVNADLLSGTSVRFVATATIGTDHVDQPYLQERGIGFTAAPGCNANSVGEYVSAALTRLEMEKGVVLQGKTLGIIGYGHVGKNLANKTVALGLQVRKYDPPLHNLALNGQGDPGEFSDLETLLADSDIISLHVPLVKTGPHPTLRMINSEFFARLTRPVVLLNTCRGEVIDEPKLMKAVQAGRIRNLVLDVFSCEPSIDQKLAAAADIVTPHIAGYSLQGKLNGTTQVANAFRRFFGIASTWSPSHPGPAHPNIHYPIAPGASSISDSAFRQHCIASAYDMLGDERHLRQSFAEPNPGQAFDRLRRDYPTRHEFTEFTVHGIPKEKSQLTSQLRNLGFQIA